MTKFTPRVLTALAVAFGMTAPVAAFAGDEEITYAKHISRILAENCERCHHPGGIGPFSFSTYRQAKGWSKMINEVVQARRMPPWHADADVGHFANDRRLSDEEVAQVATWVENGMPRGDAADMPELTKYDTDVRWRIGNGTPDQIFTMPEEVQIRPTGVMPYVIKQVPTNFKEDMWIQEMEAMPGNSKVVHHILMYVRTPDQQDGSMNDFLRLGAGFLTGYAPGTVEQTTPTGIGIKIPAGSSLIFQMHYTPTGKSEVDQSSFGVVFAKEEPKHEMLTATSVNFDFKIPANAENYPVTADLEVPRDTLLFSMTPHMHYRGKSFEYVAKYPDGTEEALLRVSNYDFNWQISYALAEPAFLPKGTILHTKALFDNSANNPYNPDPTKPVTWGDQTWEEMMIGWMTIAWVDSEDDVEFIRNAVAEETKKRYSDD